MSALDYIQRLLTGRNFFVCMLSTVVLIGSSARSLAELNEKELTQFVKTAIADNSLMYDPPTVSVREGVLNYRPGKIFYPNYQSIPSRPLGFPIDTQVKVELIRKYRADEKTEFTFLEPYLARMEKIVAEELALIAKHTGSQEALIKELSEQNDRANKILDEGISEWAKNQGLTLGESQPAAVIPSVKFQTEPAGATIYYLNAVDYNVYKAAGVIDEIDRWNQVAGTQMDMGGAYYFRATWPDKKTKQTAKILIDQDRTISIQAD